MQKKTLVVGRLGGGVGRRDVRAFEDELVRASGWNAPVERLGVWTMLGSQMIEDLGPGEMAAEFIFRGALLLLPDAFDAEEVELLAAGTWFGRVWAVEVAAMSVELLERVSLRTCLRFRWQLLLHADGAGELPVDVFCVGEPEEVGLGLGLLERAEDGDVVVALVLRDDLAVRVVGSEAVVMGVHEVAALVLPLRLVWRHGGRLLLRRLLLGRLLPGHGCCLLLGEASQEMLLVEKLERE